MVVPRPIQLPQLVWVAALIVAVIASPLQAETPNLTFLPVAAKDTNHSSPHVTGTGGWEWAVHKAKHAVSTLSLAEKVNLTGGIGSVGRCEGTLGRVDKLGIPELCFQDGPAGFRSSDLVTVFPAALTTGATWNPALMEKRGEAMAAEFRGKGVNVLLGPATGGPLGRSPYQGRNWEGFSTDPFLTGAAAYATVKGMQSQGVIATTKHFLVYEQETFRQLYAADDPWTLNSINNTVNTYSANVEDRTLHELYLKPFMHAVRAGTGAVMCVYNQINGTQGCENSYVLNKILKEELDFQGFIVSDWSAVFNTTPAVSAGVDVIMPGGSTTGGYRNQVGGPALIEAVKNGEVSEARVNDMATRFLAQYYLRHQDKGYPHVNYKDGYQGTYLNGTLVNEHMNVQADHRKVAREVAEEAITLIFNRGGENAVGPNGLQAYGTGLPLNKRAKVAVFGGDGGPNPYGINGCQGWLGPGSQLCPGNHTNNGTNAIGWGSGAGYFPYLIDPLAGIQAAVQVNGQGSVDSFTDDSKIDNADSRKVIERLAEVSDASLVFVQARSGEDSDRSSLELEAQGDKLIQMVASQSNNTIVVVHTTGPVWMDKWFHHPNVTALVLPHLPGQESGNTLAKMLYGEISPSGRMPYSVLSQNDSDAYPQIVREMEDDGTIPVNFDEKLFIDYRKWDRDNITPLIHFGHGVSYTTFEHSKHLSVSAVTDGSAYPSEVPVETRGKAPGGTNKLWEYVVQASVEVTNTGSRAGKEVSQLYIELPNSVKDTPRKQLAGFEKISLKAGETKKASFKITRLDMSYWSVHQQRFVVPDGKFNLYAGSSSADAKLVAMKSFTVKDGNVEV